MVAEGRLQAAGQGCRPGGALDCVIGVASMKGRTDKRFKLYFDQGAAIFEVLKTETSGRDGRHDRTVCGT